MPRLCSTKIVATLGPATSDPTTIKRLFEAGADVFRLNFSHGTHDDHRRRYDAVRAVEQELGSPIGILLDLQGPKLRVGGFVDGRAELATGAAFRLDLDPAPGSAARATLPHPEIFAALADDAELLIDDGKLRLRVLRHGPDFAECEVVTGGTISDRKGVNVPGVVLPISPLTAKDRRDLAFGLELGVDWVALSFVQRPEDMAEARRLVQGRAGVLAKLEKPSAIQRLEEIVDLSDAVMVARGDLGVEMPPETVPGTQKRIVRLCRRAGKPVIVATQMLETMIGAPTPTRAEASDVATAVYDGADAVMLSAETASGRYPLEAVTIMEKIIASVEGDPLYRPIMDAVHAEPEHTAADAITAAARQVAHTVRASAIVTYTTSGSTTLRAARERPDVPILCLTERLATARRLMLAWGVHPVVTADVRDFEEMVEKACRFAKTTGLARAGDRVVITAGVPFGTPGATNVLRLAWVE
jgi:pyruvate kinase